MGAEFFERLKGIFLYIEGYWSEFRRFGRDERNLHDFFRKFKMSS